MTGRLAVLASGLILASCAPPAPPPTLPKPVPVASAVRLQAGCLLPEPALFAGVDASLVVMKIDVNPDGRAARAEIVQSTRNATLDAAFTKAALNCRFTPSMLADEPVAGTYTLEHRWHAKDGFQGPRRCFLPEYPRAAQRAGTTGEVRVRFRLAGPAGEPEVWLHPEGTDRFLARAAVDAVRACLARPEARLGLREDAVYELPFTFRLD